MEELICREGTVHSVIFQNAENGYTVLRLLTEEGEVVTVVGCIPCVAPGEHLTVTGTWEVHPQHGEQLKAQELERTLPEEEEEIFAYLSSGICKGVGPTTARRIVDRFGLETLDILEAEPERLQEIRGITTKKAMEIGELFRQHMGLRRLMEFLSRYQLPPVLAIRLRQQYGDGAIRVVEKNPYLLSDDVCGVDFSVTDTMALSMGFAEDCTERLEAALTFELTYNENNGHVFLPKDKLLAATCQLLGCGVEQVEAALDALAEHHAVVIQRIANVEAVYLRRLWEAETSACARLLALLEMDADESRFADRTVAEIEKDYLRPLAAAGGRAGGEGWCHPADRRSRHRQDHHRPGHRGPVSENGAEHRAGGPHGPCGEAHERADGHGGSDGPPAAGYDVE